MGNHDVVTILEIKKAIRGMALGKAPGPDGYPVEIYKNLGAL